MKLYLITLFLSSLFSTSLLAVSLPDTKAEIKAQLDSCHKIKCDGLNDKEKMSCNKSRGLCYRNVLKERVAIWKELGISSKERDGVIKSLQQTEKKNKELHDSLISEAQYIEKILQEIRDLKKEVQSLKPAK